MGPSASGSMQARRPAHRRVGLAAVAIACLFVALAPRPAAAQANDPWVGLNRPVFRFNDGLDRYILEPVAKGYDFILPGFARTGVTNFFANLWFPVVFTNCVLQAKPLEATQSLTRFFVNTTVGVGGLFDVASRAEVPAPNEDFGQTLGYWGVPTGPYLVIPFLGPSNIRDTVGRTADGFTRVWPFFVPWYVATAGGTLEIINLRANYLEEVKDLRESSVDYYAAVRNAYMQRREALVEDRVGAGNDAGSLPADTDLYFPGE